MRAWGEAWHTSLYGPDGFFLRERPLDHFRTNAAVPLFAEVVRRLAERVDAALGHPDPFDVVDLGAGGGELLAGLGEVPARWRLTPVEVGDPVPPVTGLMVANEYLDAVPLDVLEDGRLVLVSDSGEESLGAPLSSEWADRWWPGGGRVEVGAPRDLAWAAAVARVQRGLAVAVDYGHDLTNRRPTLTGYRHGRQVPPVPDGSCDLTAHVALDSAAAATGSAVLTQRAALRALGVEGSFDGTAYGLERASQAAELLDPAGLGGFGWLVREVGLPAGWMTW